jgi:F-type H+-transporting ATPase subunit b
MGETLNQLGELLLSSIPAILGLLIVWVAYRWIVYGRLQQVLGERQARTEGAVKQAQEQIASAEARTAEYERKVREARAHIYQGQEVRRRRTMEEREAALAEARRQADATVKEARAALEKDTLAAKTSLEQQADGLANQIIESVLKPAVAAGGR